jgi:hypothetical protein
MLFRPQAAAGSQTDPHDAIVAQLRELAPRIKNTQQVEEAALPTSPTPPSIEESQVPAAPSNDNADAFQGVIPRGRSYRGIIFAVLLAVCAGVAATMAWQFYQEEVTQSLSRLTSHFLMQNPPAETQDTAAQVAPPRPTAQAEPAQEAAPLVTEGSTPSTDPSPDPTQAQAPPVQAALPAETAQTLKTMESDIAALKQAVDELRASEQQLRREAAKAAERETHPKAAQHPAKPAASRRQSTSPRASIPSRPPQVPAQPSAPEGGIHRQEPIQRDAYIPTIPAQAPAPSRLPPQPGDDSAPRPPMPLR